MHPARVLFYRLEASFKLSLLHVHFYTRKKRLWETMRPVCLRSYPSSLLQTVPVGTLWVPLFVGPFLCGRHWRHSPGKWRESKSTIGTIQWQSIQSSARPTIMVYAFWILVFMSSLWMLVDTDETLLGNVRIREVKWPGGEVSSLVTERKHSNSWHVTNVFRAWCYFLYL